MEIFQTIWTALTTENEILANLIFLPEPMVESLINVLIFTTLLNINIDRKTKNKYIIFISIFLYLTGIFIPNPYKSFLNLVVIILSIHFFLHINFLKSILCAILPILFDVLCESLVIKTSIYYFNFDATALASIPIYKLVLTLGIQLLVFILYLIIKYSKVQISILENMSNKIKVIFILNLIFAILAITVQFIITGFYIERLPWYIVIFSNISLILYFLLSIYSLTKTTQLEITSLDLAQEKEHNRILKLSQDDLRGFRHDFSNIMCTIGGYVQVADMDGLKKYYSQIQKDINKINTLGALNPDCINNPAIFALISSKYNKALEENIEVTVNAFLNFDDLNMKIYEFTRILGILLDNSIEAAKECDEKIITIEIRKDTKRNRQLLIIQNTYTNKDVNTDKIYEKNYSTKPGNSGLGLWEVRQILKKNNNLNLFTSKTDKFFKQQLEMYDR